MKKLPDLKQLSDEPKDALIVELWQEIQKLRTALKPDSSPAKTSSNSSTPPSCLIQAEYQALAIENRMSQIIKSAIGCHNGTKGDANVLDYRFSLAFYDIGKQGNLAGIVFGMQLLSTNLQKGWLRLCCINSLPLFLPPLS